jgi:hypothetical protein
MNIAEDGPYPRTVLSKTNEEKNNTKELTLKYYL